MGFFKIYIYILFIISFNFRYTETRKKVKCQHNVEWPMKNGWLKYQTLTTRPCLPSRRLTPKLMMRWCDRCSRCVVISSFKCFRTFTKNCFILLKCNYVCLIIPCLSLKNNEIYKNYNMKNIQYNMIKRKKLLGNPQSFGMKLECAGIGI